MLCTLRTRNLAIVDELEIEFLPGLNVITGETGAGKSIVLKAIELLTGKRTSAEILRAGTDKCEIEGLFTLPDTTRQELANLNDEVQDLATADELLIRRTIDQSGRSKFYLNGSLTTAGVLQHLSIHLLDITGQHSQVGMLDSESHRRLLDEFGVPLELRVAVKAQYQIYSEAKRRLESFVQEASKREEYLHRIRFEREELEQLALEDGEEERIEDELKRLSNVEVVAASLDDALQMIESSDGGIELELTRLHTTLSRLADLDSHLAAACSLTQSAALQIEETHLELTRYAAKLQADPERLEMLRERISEIKRIKRKYQKAIPELLQHLASICQDLDAYDSGAVNEKTLREQLLTVTAALEVSEQALTAARKSAAQKLAKLVESGLAELEMKRARFEVSVQEKERTSYGSDAVQFLLAANPGEPFRDLDKVASGGELARLLLVLKTILNEQAGPVLQVYDEVDTGIGGAVSQIVGEKLKAVSKKAQVIVVTHAPQIAAFADQHLQLSKHVKNSETFVVAKALSSEEQVKELARMLAGKKITANFEDSARELLAQSSQSQKKSNAGSRKTARSAVR